MNTPTPAHVALVNEFTHAAFEFGTSYAKGKPGQPAESKRLADAGVAIYAALAQPALAAPVPSTDEPVWFHAECDDPDHSGFFQSQGDAETQVNDYGGDVTALYDGPVPAMVAAQQPTPAASPEDWRKPTTYLQRFGDALQLLCAGRRPTDDLMTAWLDNKSEELQDFCSEYGPSWAQGIGLIDAARMTADQPTEGVDHEYMQPVETSPTHYNTTDNELSLLLELTDDMATGKANMDTAIWWMNTLEGIQDRLAKSPAVEVAAPVAPTEPTDERAKFIVWMAGRIHPAGAPHFGVAERAAALEWDDGLPGLMAASAWRAALSAQPQVLSDAQIDALQKSALSIFVVKETAQDVRDVIEWFTNTLRVQQ